MMDWNVFYRAIGIAEDIIEPSHYHILGLEARDCDRDKVEKALADRKRELRQSIPSPEFVTLVIQFEKEVLEPAAEVLADDEKRSAYNKELLSRQREVEIHNRKKQKLVDDVREAIAEVVDEKGCLGGVERYLLEEKLRLLEVQEHNIKQILARIPEPADTPFFDQQRLLMFFAGAVQLSIKDDVLGTAEEQTLTQLAARLGLDTMQARLIIDQQLAQLTARRQGAPDDGGNIDGIILEKPIRMDGEPQEEPKEEPAPAPKKRRKPKKQPVPPEDIHEVVEDMHRITSEKVFQVVMPIMAILVFIAVVYFLNAMVQKRRAVPDMSSILPVNLPETKPQQPAADGKELSKPAVEPSPAAVPTSPQEPQIVQITQFDSDIQKTEFLPSSSRTPQQLLDDIAELMLEIRNKAADFRQVRRISLDRIFGTIDEIRLDEIQQELNQLRIDELKAILSSEQQADRLYAVTRLGSMRQMPAYEILLEALGDRVVTGGNRVMVPRILAELAQSDSNHVAHKLAEIMERTGRQTAFQIQMALMTMTQIDGTLPLKNTIQQRKAASQWWQANLWNWDSSFTPAKMPPVPQELLAPIQQTATIAQSARQAADILSPADLADDEEFTQRLEFKYGFNAPGLKLLKHSPAAAAGLLADALDQLARTDQATAVQADMVMLDRRRTTLRSEGDLQTAAVNMAAANGCLVIMAAQADTKGQYRQLLEGFRQAYQLTVLETDSPASALRNECYLNVLYWDLLLDIRGKEEK
ncbi:MAG: hypothetical protein ACYSUT_10740 [Planctomycetota bacterium]|jgi:hypothetical protein